MFTDPRIKLPRDGEEVQFKVTGDPVILGVEEPTLGHFKAPSNEPEQVHHDMFLGTFVEERSGRGFQAWRNNEYEVAAWRPRTEFTDELH